MEFTYWAIFWNNKNLEYRNTVVILMLKEDDFGKIFFILGQTFKNRQILHCI